MRYVVAFVRFWWSFVVGDDWRVAAGLLAALALTWILAHHGLAAWWPLPLGAGLLLVGSVADEARKSGRA